MWTAESTESVEDGFSDSTGSHIVQGSCSRPFREVVAHSQNGILIPFCRSQQAHKVYANLMRNLWSDRYWCWVRLAKKKRRICLLARLTRAAVLLDVFKHVVEGKRGKSLIFTGKSSSEISLNRKQQRVTWVAGAGAATLQT